MSTWISLDGLWKDLSPSWDALAKDWMKLSFHILSEFQHYLDENDNEMIKWKYLDWMQVPLNLIARRYEVAIKQNMYKNQ